MWLSFKKKEDRDNLDKNTFKAFCFDLGGSTSELLRRVLRYHVGLPVGQFAYVDCNALCYFLADFLRQKGTGGVEMRRPKEYG